MAKPTFLNLEQQEYTPDKYFRVCICDTCVKEGQLNVESYRKCEYQNDDKVLEILEYPEWKKSLPLQADCLQIRLQHLIIQAKNEQLEQYLSGNLQAILWI